LVRVFLPEELREHKIRGVNGLSLFIRSNESLSGIASLFSFDFGSVAVDHRLVPIAECSSVNAPCVSDKWNRRVMWLRSD